MKKSVIIGLLVTFAAITGFGATPSKPDFAFPKTVSKTAQAQLKTAEKKKDGPATVRALIDYSLAQVAINPDNSDSALEFMAKVQGRTQSPVTCAMIQLARANMAGNDSLAVDAIARYSGELRLEPTHAWRSVVNADEQFFPTLYDFAVASVPDLPDSILNEALAYDRERLYPLIYLELSRTYGYDALLKLYERFKSTPVAVYPMLALARTASSLDERREVYSLLNALPDKTDEVRAAIAYLLRSEITSECNTVVGRNKELKIKVSATCLNEAVLDIYEEEPQQRYLTPVKLTFAGEGVFSADTTVSITLKNYGKYRIIPRFAGLKEKNPSYSPVTVTDFLLARQIYGKRQWPVMALDVINGAEQADVKFTTVKRNQIKGERGADVYSPTIYNGQGYEPSNDSRRSANVVTDRAIYHPGDTMRFAATLMEAKGMHRSLLTGFPVKVTLFNANYQPIDTLELRSDDFGRINGAFAIPSEGLLGYYPMEINNFNFGHAMFMVADYKAPTFDVKLRAERIDSTSVELRGSAVGYNGMPLADAQIALSIKEQPVWVWYRDFRNAYGAIVASDTVTADSAGEFSVRMQVPAATNLSASVTATSLAGESHDAQAFIPFYRYFIEGEVGYFVDAANPPRFTLRNADDGAVDLPMTQTLVADGVTIVPDSVWSNVPSGIYRLTVSADDAHPSTYDIEVYRRSDLMPPSESGLFIPVTTAEPGSRLLVGTSFADSHILMVKYTPDSILEQRWLTPERGNFFIDITLPDSVDNATLSFLTLRDYRFLTRTVSIRRPDVARSLVLKVESMRNRMIPGESETWTLSVADNMGRAQQAAVMLNVYSQALDALRRLPWSFNAPPLWGRSLNFNYANSYTDRSSNGSMPKLASPLANVSARFDLYGLRMAVRTGLYLTEKAMSRNVLTSASKMAMMDSYESDEAVLEESAADTGGIESKANLKIRGTGSATDAAANDGYRLPELPVALWMPTLTTATDGSLQLTFTAPNANTTWAVKALAYNRELLSGLFEADIVASKPIMVQPQLPRFMRAGDSIELRALVQNATDSVAPAASLIEIFNPANDSVIAAHQFADTIAANGSALISAPFIAPQGVALVGIRVRTSSGRYADGEQSLLPILPSEMTVTTGTPLFLPSDSTETTISVPRGGTLTFTANATWECVAQLPGLSAPQGRSALTAANQLFSAATARGLMRSHPEIGRALHSWEQSDSVLVSRLMRNDDLKLALLSSTPFLGAAQRQSEQRARLLLLFNNKLIDRNIADAVATLTKLTRNGGLAWVEGNSEASQWVTLRVLSTLADLRRMGYAPENPALKKLTVAAVEYLDREVAREFAKNKKATFPAYVMLRSRFADVRQSVPARRAAEATVQHLVGHWRDLALPELARAAIILNENNYPTTARKLIESLRQREAWNQMPLDPVLLNAFASIEPQCPEVEIIRNAWLSRLQSADASARTDVSALVAAILNSGQTWLVPAANSLSVSIDGCSADVSANSYLGEFRLDLPSGGQVEIRKGAYPAWGGVFSNATDSVGSVEPFASDRLKLTRSISGRMAPGEKITVTLTLEAAQPIDYVVVTQPLCAAFQAVDQLPSIVYTGMAPAYREPTASQTNWYITRLPKGKTQLTETFYVTASGSFTLAPAQAQSQYAPEFQSHTAGLHL